ncbi:hypothetical protein EVA_20671, partial [gut metagenome]
VGTCQAWGEWIDMMSDTGLGKIAKDSIDSVKNEAHGEKHLYVQNEVVQALNDALNKVGGNSVDLFGSESKKDYYWSSSEHYSKNNAYKYAFTLHFGTDNLSFHYHSKYHSYKVRCILAF